MIIPLKHENMQGRRWPVITIGIIVLNCVVFLGTHWTIERESEQLGTLKAHILLLAANHPNVPMTPAEQRIVDSFKTSYPSLFARAASTSRQPEDAWDLRMRLWEEPRCEEEMVLLGQQWDQAERNSILERYAYTPSHPTGISYLTANFLHGGWLHLIFNMWFLWLAGGILEDVWGRIVYPIFYLVAGFLALYVHGLIFPHSIVPTLGASGAIAALMGAFLIRFPTTKIQLGWLWLWFRPRLYRFSWPAFAVLPIWILGQIFWASVQGEAGGVAYWAHIGGFGFGMVGALLLRLSGIEHKMDQAIEAKVSWSADPRFVEATEHMDKNQPELAIAELQKLLHETPDHADALQLLASAYWKKQDVEAYRQTLVKLCRLHLKMHQTEDAWQDYEDFRNAGGAPLPVEVWLELCRYLESRQNWERAVAEYENLAQGWPNERSAVLALISAARINLRTLNRRDEATRLYRAADSSPAPHRDWEDTIQRGLREANGAAAASPGAPPAEKPILIR